MAKIKFLSSEFLPNFHDKEKSIARIADSKNIAQKICSQLILMNILALVYGVIMVSFGSIVLFFLITGGNYAFIKLLHVAVIALAGLFGMKHIVDALKYSCEKKNVYPKTGIVVFRFWIIIMFFVGCQLSWSLRPFVGAKDQPFQVFRKQQGNFYQAFGRSVADLFGHSERSGR